MSKAIVRRFLENPPAKAVIACAEIQVTLFSFNQFSVDADSAVGGQLSRMTSI